MIVGDVIRAACLVCVVGVSVYTDVRYGKIYNKIVLPCIPGGLLVWGVSSGLEGLMAGVFGLAVGSIALLIAGGVKWMAPGDAKLIAAVGALMGAGYVGSVMIYGAIAGGVMALAVMTKKRVLTKWATDSAVAWSAHLPVSSFWVGRAGYLPYSVPIAIGCAIAGAYPLW